ncbi:unnamed protein product [Amoebophrya sp. A120]|nr:unnamed protein product [Amoebophrya sp. A120]|eukprot:GSA120T00003817001.1
MARGGVSFRVRAAAARAAELLLLQCSTSLFSPTPLLFFSGGPRGVHAMKKKIETDNHGTMEIDVEDDEFFQMGVDMHARGDFPYPVKIGFEKAEREEDGAWITKNWRKWKTELVTHALASFGPHEWKFFRTKWLPGNKKLVGAKKVDKILSDFKRHRYWYYYDPEGAKQQQKRDKEVKEAAKKRKMEKLKTSTTTTSTTTASVGQAKKNSAKTAGKEAKKGKQQDKIVKEDAENKDKLAASIKFVPEEQKNENGASSVPDLELLQQEEKMRYGGKKPPTQVTFNTRPKDPDARDSDADEDFELWNHRSKHAKAKRNAPKAVKDKYFAKGGKTWAEEQLEKQRKRDADLDQKIKEEKRQKKDKKSKDDEGTAKKNKVEKTSKSKADQEAEDQKIIKKAAEENQKMEERYTAAAKKKKKEAAEQAEKKKKQDEETAKEKKQHEEAEKEKQEEAEAQKIEEKAEAKRKHNLALDYANKLVQQASADYEKKKAAAEKKESQKKKKKAAKSVKKPAKTVKGEL